MQNMTRIVVILGSFDYTNCLIVNSKCWFNLTGAFNLDHDCIQTAAQLSI